MGCGSSSVANAPASAPAPAPPVVAPLIPPVVVPIAELSYWDRSPIEERVALPVPLLVVHRISDSQPKESVSSEESMKAIAPDENTDSYERDWGATSIPLTQ